MKSKKIISIFFVLFCVVSLGFSKSAENSVKTKKTIGLETGLNLVNLYPIGEFSDYAKATFGAEIFVNYFLPKKIVKTENFGITANFGLNKVFSNEKYLEKFSMNYFSVGAFYLLNLPKNFQIKPQLNIGFINHKTKGGYEMKDSYFDLMFSVSCDLRYDFKYNIIFNFSPVYNFIPVNDGVIHYFGVKLGACYCF